MMFVSSTTPLPAGNTFTSPVMVSNTADTITGTLFADQAGNLFVEQSNDGTNWDLSKTIAYTASAVTAVINEVVVASFVRIRFTNTAGSPQTALRLFVNLRSGGVKP